MPEINAPVIPQNITVHLGAPDSPAENVTVPFDYYIKNVASNEIYPTWPENALRANIYAIISYALNRIYTEWYRSRGYDFDITNTTAFDQAFNKDGEVFDNISLIVDEIFNDYIARQGNIEPLFAQFCNGTTSTCAGLSQWGTVSLANEGLIPYAILQRYYGEDINIVNDAPVSEVDESYPGAPLVLGDSGNNVKTIQVQLNRIGQNYPAIPRIARTDGVFGIDTQEAVRKFQEIFNLSQTGSVDKSTWYKIKQYYVGVKSLSDLVSEGVSLEEATLPFSTRLSQGMQGIAVRTLQYYLNILAYFNPNLNPLPLDGVFGPETTQAVRDFQGLYGLTQTGVVTSPTWINLQNAYRETVSALPAGYEGTRAKLYPGYFLSEGMSGSDVTNLQTYLARIGRSYAQVPEIPVTGYFGSQTRAAVEAFQSLFGLPVNGAVGPVTWNTIANQYNFLVETEGV
ncbi:MAG: peptidoglycan-binding protein [Clostridia bacterium]|nr:peptidoglycan-binding protein [Clostridia bacterium]